MRRIIETTDGKYIGKVFDENKPICFDDVVQFDTDKVQDLGNGFVRYSNSSYVILTKEVK